MGITSCCKDKIENLYEAQWDISMNNHLNASVLSSTVLENSKKTGNSEKQIKLARNYDINKLTYIQRKIRDFLKRIAIENNTNFKGSKLAKIFRRGSGSVASHKSSAHLSMSTQSKSGRKSSSELLNQASNLVSSEAVKRYNYIGEYSGSKKCGFGVQFFKDNSCYVGQWKDDKMCGLGILKSQDGYSFKGYFANNSMTGFGLQISSSYVFEGIWNKNQKEGYGILQ